MRLVWQSKLDEQAIPRLPAPSLQSISVGESPKQKGAELQQSELVEQGVVMHPPVVVKHMPLEHASPVSQSFVEAQ